MSKNRKWKGNTGGSFIGQQLLIVFLKLFNIRIAYVIVAFIVPLYMIFLHKNYKAIFHFFRKQLSYSILRSFIMTYKNHFIFGQIILDRFAVFAGQKKLFKVEIIGKEHFDNLANNDKGFVIAGSHVGNFEIGGYLLHSHKKKINAVVFSGETKTVQANRKKVFDNKNIGLIPVSGNMSHLFAVYEALQKGEIVSMPCDRILGSRKKIECNFMNGKADFPIGAFALAVNFDVKIISIFVIKQSSKKYTVYVKPIDANVDENISKREKIERYANLYVNELENIVRNYPVQWFNYYEFWKNDG
jgi:predicted LPLAT superfamily acyltransferase